MFVEIREERKLRERMGSERRKRSGAVGWRLSGGERVEEKEEEEVEGRVRGGE